MSSIIEEDAAVAAILCAWVLERAWKGLERLGRLESWGD